MIDDLKLTSSSMIAFFQRNTQRNLSDFIRIWYIW